MTDVYSRRAILTTSGFARVLVTRGWPNLPTSSSSRTFHFRLPEPYLGARVLDRRLVTNVNAVARIMSRFVQREKPKKMTIH